MFKLSHRPLLSPLKRNKNSTRASIKMGKKLNETNRDNLIIVKGIQSHKLWVGTSMGVNRVGTNKTPRWIGYWTRTGMRRGKPKGI